MNLSKTQRCVLRDAYGAKVKLAPKAERFLQGLGQRGLVRYRRTKDKWWDVTLTAEGKAFAKQMGGTK